MRGPASIWLAWLAVPLLAACNQGASQGTTALESEDAKLNYTVGWQIGNDYKRQNVPLDEAALVAGVRDATEGKEARIPEKEQRELLAQVRQRTMAAEQAEQGAEAEKNLAAAKAFLETNAAKEGVKTLPSGLQYKVLSEGKGPKPAATDVVTVHYKGTLIDGTEFDSSYGRGEPATFPLNKVIKGWTEGLQLMGEGAKWVLYVPPSLGYGERGAGARIPPQSALVFEVELIKAKAN
jgi:FKBP-type peptidyl-prolyl cis-trans isomerase FklB